MIIKGHARVVNDFQERVNNSDKAIKAPEKGRLSKDDLFGASKFLKQQSYTFFGNIRAGEQSKPPQ